MARPTPTDELMWQRLFARSEGHSRSLQGRLRDTLVHAVMEGYLAPGQALPSSRWLARLLKLSRSTTTLALAALVDKGLVEAHARSGHVVSRRLADTYLGARERSRAAAPGDARLRWDERLKLKPSAQRNIVKPADWQRQPYPFIYGQFDATLFPRADWRECVLDTVQTRALKRWAPDHIDRDDELLVEQIHRRLLPARGIWAERDEILVTAGAQQATFLLAQLLVGPTTTVGIENPGYPDARNNFALRTRHLRLLRVDDQGLQLQPALAGCALVYVTPSHQCPTTVTLPLARRQELLARAARDDFIVIEDDHESELNFSGRPTPALKSLDDAGRVIYLGSLSKTLAHGLRLGCVVAPRELIRELRALRRLVMRHVPTNNQQAAAAFIERGHQEAFVRRLNVAYRERSRALREALAAELPELRAATTGGGSALWVEGPPRLDARRLAAEAYRAGVVVEPGDVFFGGSRAPARFLRIGYSSIALERIEAGVRALAGVLRRHLNAAPSVTLRPRAARQGAAVLES